MSAIQPTNSDLRTLRMLIDDAFSASTTMVNVTDAGQGRGIFSRVFRVALREGSAAMSVIAKLEADGPNGAAAISSGAVAREALAYTTLLEGCAVRRPDLLALQHGDGGSVAFLLEDLGALRAADQLVGLDAADTLAVVDALSGLHRHFASNPPQNVRTFTPAVFSVGALRAGIEVLGPRWNLSADLVHVFRSLVDHRDELLDRFRSIPVTLCHGDARADNLVFDSNREAILFDWQQVAVQCGEADLAWLLATSLAAATRQSVSVQLVERYADQMDKVPDAVAHNLREAFVLPGFAVLMLAQRIPDSERTAQFIQTSVERIALAVAEDGPQLP